VYREVTKVRSEWEGRLKGPNLSLLLLNREFVTGFTPETVTFGVSYKVIERLRLSGEISWYRWSMYDGPLDTGFQSDFNDVWVPRLGVLYRLTRNIDLRFGFYYEPTPVTSQPAGFYPIGNDRFVYSTGIGYSFKDPWGILAKPLSVDGYFQYHMLKKEDFDRALPPTPYTRNADLTSGGYALNMGFNLTFHF
jgi:long-subunit fatty acid transport protein